MSDCCIFPFCYEPVVDLGPAGWTCAAHRGRIPEAEGEP